MTSNQTDIELIGMVLRENNSRAFAALMQRYSMQVYVAALRLMKDEDNAQEIVQMAFIQAYKQLASWRGETFGAWVTIIANHMALRMLEKEKRRPTVSIDETDDDAEDENRSAVILQADEGYDEEREQRLQALETAVSRLPEQDQQIIRWHYYDSVPLQTIADRLGQTENNIKVRVFRIRERIKKMMQS